MYVRSIYVCLRYAGNIAFFNYDFQASRNFASLIKEETDAEFLTAETVHYLSVEF
jgi:hypothetical protein